MFSDSDVRAVLVEYIKNNSAIIGITSVEIREWRYQGRDFIYPSARVRVIQQKPAPDVNCDWSDIQFGVQLFSEQASSDESEQMEAVATSLLDKHTVSSMAIKIYALHCLGMLAAQRIDERTWMAET